jgi:excisionase family DNA binding protein
MDRLLTSGETAKALRLSVAALHTMRHRGGGPPAVRVGRKLLFRESDIEQWVAERAEQGRR